MAVGRQQWDSGRVLPTSHLPHNLTPLVAFNADHEHLQVRGAQVLEPKARQRVGELGYGHRDLAALHEVLAKTSEATV